MAYDRKDTYYRRAKGEGYRSRAAYKLLELDRRHRLMKKGDRVLDLGCWPGGWLQVAAACVGPKGRVVGVDLAAGEPLPEPWVDVFCADVRDENVRHMIGASLGGTADLILSDMAPKLSGIRDRDQAQMDDLVRVALDVARGLLRPGGQLLVKLFDGSGLQALLAELRGDFARVVLIRPDASRKGSAEIYAFCSGFAARPG